MFSHLSSWKSHKCVLKYLQQGTFFRDEQFEDHMPRSTLKMNVFQSISLETHKCVVKPHNRAHFSEKSNLRGYIPRFTLKMNVFPSISLKTHKCVLKHSEQGSFCWDHQFEGLHTLVYSQNKCFPIYLLGNHINVCWKHLQQGTFFWDEQFEDHMPRSTLKMNVFQSISLESP